APRGRWPSRSSGVGAGRAAVRSRSWRDLLGLVRDDVAVVGELPDQRIDLAQGEGGRRRALEVATNEAVLRDAEFQGGGTRLVGQGGAVAPDEGQGAENPADPDLAVAPMNTLA